MVFYFLICGKVYKYLYVYGYVMGLFFLYIVIKLEILKYLENVFVFLVKWLWNNFEIIL